MLDYESPDYSRRHRRVVPWIIGPRIVLRVVGLLLVIWLIWRVDH